MCRDAEEKSKIVAGCDQYMNDCLDLYDMRHEQMVVFASDPCFEAMRRLQCLVTRFGYGAAWCRGGVQTKYSARRPWPTILWAATNVVSLATVIAVLLRPASIPGRGHPGG